RQEGDDIRTKAVLAALVAALLFAGGSVFWGWLELRADTARYAPRRPPAVRPAPAGPPAISGVLQTLAGADSSAAGLVASKRERLESWGWVDRSRGIVYMPIDAAMRALVEQPAPQPGGRP